MDQEALTDLLTSTTTLESKLKDYLEVNENRDGAYSKTGVAAPDLDDAGHERNLQENEPSVEVGQSQG